MRNFFSLTPDLTLRKVAITVTTLFILFGLIYSVLVPSWEIPDEPAHFSHALFLRETLSLPVQQLQGGIETSHHPPLFYILAALASFPANVQDTQGVFHANPNFLWGARGGREVNIHQLSTADTFPYQGVALALHLVRLLSVLISAGTVALTFALAREIFPQRRSIACLAAILVAFNPQFLFISAGAMNDGLVVMAATGAMWRMLYAARRPFLARNWLVVGVWASIATLAKISGVVLVPLGALVLLICALRDRNFNVLWQGGLAFGLPLLALTGWWFARNIWLYGDVFGTEIWMKRYPGAVHSGPLLLGPLLEAQFNSFWGVFGWRSVAAPSWFFLAVQILMLVSAVGLIRYVILTIKNAKSTSHPELFGVVFCAGVVVLMELVMIRENLRFITAVQGRYLFPAIAPFMILVSLGLHRLIPPHISKPAFVGLTTAYLAVALYMPFGVIAPNYPMHNTLPRSSLWFAPNPVSYTFGNTFGLRSYEVKRTPNGDLRLRLFWVARQKPPFDYSSFAHLYATSAVQTPNAPLLAQQDQAPGANHNYSPSAWSVGDIVTDERTLKLSQPLPEGRHQIQLGVYNAQTGERLPAFSSDQPIGDSVSLGFAWPPP